VSTEPSAASSPRARISYSPGYRRAVALLLMLAYTANSADRTLIAIIGQPMKLDLGLSDTQLGLLIGTAFVLLYTLSGVVVARLAERYSRVAIIAVMTTLWSVLTGFLGAAQNYAQLLVTRMLVGVFEAGCTPPAHSLLSDYFEPQQRATALSFYSCGISLGYIVSAMLGGYVALHYGWRAACVLVGLPGVVIALAIRQFVREPPRGNSERPEHGLVGATTASNGEAVHGVWEGVRRELAEFGEVARRLLLRWPIANIVAGVTISTFAAQGSWAFVPAYFNRAFGLDYATIGVVSALAGGVSVAIGLLGGGFVTDRLGSRSLKWYTLVPALGLAACAPIYAFSFAQLDWHLSAWLIAVAAFLQYLSFGPTFGVIQNVVDARRRATATALIYILLNVIGLGVGPVFTGALIDRFAEFNFAHADASTIARSFGAMLDAAPGAGVSFRLACHNGATLAGTPGCASALALASREGIFITVLLHAWAALHYVLGAVGLEREMVEAARHNARVASER